MKPKYKIRLSGAEFSRLCGVTRQGVAYATKNGLLDRDEDGKLSIESEKNASYLREHGASLEAYTEMMRIDEEKHKAAEAEKKRERAAPPDRSPETPAGKVVVEDPWPDVDNAPHDTKRAAEIRLIIQREKGLKIDNEVKLGNLVDKKLVQAIVDEIAHAIQTSFVDFPRRESPTIAAILGIPEKERDIEIHLSEKIQASILSVISTIERLASEDTFS